MSSPKLKLIQAATCIISHGKFVQLNTLLKWFIFLREQLGKHVVSGEDLGTVCRWNNTKLAFVSREEDE